MQIDSLSVLQASTTETATGQSTGVSIKLDKDYIGQAIIQVSAIDNTTTDETYVMDLEVYDGTTWRKIGGVEIPGAAGTGEYRIPYSGVTGEKLGVAAALSQARLNWTLGGTTPSITFTGYLTKI